MEQQMTTRKIELLAHYMDKEPHEFIQLDDFGPCTDSFSDGRWASMTTELMNGSIVRMLIDPKASKDDVLVAIDRLRTMVDEGQLESIKSLCMSTGPQAADDVLQGIEF
jgi:hypothetical protein